jgi:tRNA threonylcarbamoyladenosine biosynthesis protein TsaB
VPAETPVLDDLSGTDQTPGVKARLALVGCGPRLEVALWSETMPAPALVALAGPTPRSDLIMGAVDLLLRAAGLDSRDLGVVGATRGPGSFTGIRVALATAQGLAMGLGIPAHGVPSLLVLAHRSADPRCLAVQPARRGFVYAQPFARQGERCAPTGDPKILPVADLAGSELPVVAPAGLALPDGTPTISSRCTTAEALLELLASEPPQPTDLDSLVPLYLEPPPALPPTPKPSPWPPSQTTS